MSLWDQLADLVGPAELAVLAEHVTEAPPLPQQARTELGAVFQAEPAAEHRTNHAA
jgi:hypothetical protein